MINMIARVDDTTNIFYSTQKIGFKSDVIIAQSLANVRINTCDKYVTNHIHEQIVIIDNFCLPHKNWQTSICHIKSEQMSSCTRANKTRHIKIATQKLLV